VLSVKAEPRKTTGAIVVVSYLANARYAPRGIRTRALVSALERETSVEVIAGAIENSRPPRPAANRTTLRKILQLVHSSLLLDKFELWSRRRFRSWQPEAAGALLIGFPFSPLVYASRRLRAAGIPYVVDLGDPWILTVSGGRPTNRSVARRRARRAERRLWQGAAGAIVTTHGQGAALRRLFPHLEVLVRPNGFSDVRVSSPPRRPATHSDPAGRALRLVHFGDLYVARLNFQPFLDRLALSNHWDRIEFHQFGSDWTGALQAHRDVRVEFHEPRDWADVILAAVDYDLAVVIGNRDATTLPSKAVEYLQLPIPRLALVERERGDALADYVADKPGWLTLSLDRVDASAATFAHISRDWAPAELAPPRRESWESVGPEIVRFVLGCIHSVPTARSSSAETASTRSTA
jgi:hypothetical protein